MRGQPRHYRWPDAQLLPQFPGHGCMDDLTTERSFDLQATWVIDVLGKFFDMLSMGFCTTRRCQTSGRLVQELSVCTVPQKLFQFFRELSLWH